MWLLFMEEKKSLVGFVGEAGGVDNKMAIPVPYTFVRECRWLVVRRGGGDVMEMCA